MNQEEILAKENIKFDLMYDSDDSGINGQVIGKLFYSGKTSKGSLTDGKIYDCIGLSFSELRIVDDSGEPYYYHRRPSWKDRTAQFIVIEDNSPDKIMSAFVSGDESRTPHEKEIEKKYIVGMVSSGLNREGHVNKSKSRQSGFVKKTKEQVEYRESLFKQIARSFADEIIKGATEYKQNPHMFDSPVGTEFDYTKGENHYRVKRQESGWEIHKVTKVKKEETLTLFDTLPITFKDVSAVKIHLTNILKF